MFSRRTALLAFSFLAALPTAAFANSSGWTNGTLRENAGGCTGCHGNLNPNVAVTLAGPAGLLPGQMAQYAITITGPSNATARAGYNAAVTKTGNAGTQPVFSNVAGQPTATGDGSTQSSHNAAQGALPVFSAGTATYQVNLSMPAGAVLGTTQTLYATGDAGQGGDLVGWNFASNLVVTVGPPTPSTLTANQAGATGTTIPLSWTGTQGESFRVLRKLGSYPTAATGDAGATLVYEGANTSATATGLTAGTQYFFAAFGKAPAANVYSATAAQATAATIPANPTALTAVTGSSTEINLTWNGTSTEFRVLGKAGAYPANATDGTAEIVYQGTAKNVVDAGLSPGTAYFYRVWGKAPGSSVYSATFQQATASTSDQPFDRHVASTGNDQGGANACNVLATPCRSITRAMAAAGSGDSIFVQPGTYGIANGEVYPIVFKNGVKLMATGTPADTFIDGSSDAVQRGLFTSTSNTSSGTRIEGFTIRNGVHTETPGGSALGGALRLASGLTGTFTVTGNVFSNNQVLGANATGVPGQTGSLGWGGAIYVFSSNVLISNNVFVNNLARGGAALDHPGSVLSGNENGGQSAGGAIYAGGTGLIINNTFVGNAAIGGDGGVASNGIGESGSADAGAIYAGGNPAPGVVNNIFASNSARAGEGSVASAPVAGAVLAGNAMPLTNNLFFGNLEGSSPSLGDTIGTNAVLANPKFHATTVFRLRNSSPARGAGTATNAPLIDLEELTRPVPPSIGAYEAAILSQTLQFGPAPTVSAGGTATVVVAPGASSSPVVITSQTPGTCTVQGTVVTGVAAGACTLLANQAADADYTAAPQVSLTFNVLAQPSFALTVVRSGAGSGSGLVTSSPAGIDCGNTCSNNFMQNVVVSLSANAHAGSVFTGWSGDCAGAQPVCQVTMAAARNVTAQFGPDGNAASRIFGNGFEN